jgi:hypothetical protein
MIVLSGRVQGFMPDIETQQRYSDRGTRLAVMGAACVPVLGKQSLRNVSREVPIIGPNGARSGGDVLRFLLSGARAVELASALITKRAGDLPVSSPSCIRIASASKLRGSPNSSAKLRMRLTYDQISPKKPGNIPGNNEPLRRFILFSCCPAQSFRSCFQC